MLVLHNYLSHRVVIDSIVVYEQTKLRGSDIIFNMKYDIILYHSLTKTKDQRQRRRTISKTLNYRLLTLDKNAQRF